MNRKLDNAIVFSFKKLQRFYIFDDGDWKPVKVAMNDTLDSTDQRPYIPYIPKHEPAFRYMKLIQVDKQSSDRLSLSWDINHVSHHGMNSLLNYLKSDNGKLSTIKIKYFDCGWVHETYKNAHITARRIIEIQSHAGSSQTQGIYTEEHQISDETNQYFKNACHTIKSLKKIWSEGKLNIDIDSKTGNHTVDDVILRYQLDEKDNEFYLTYYGKHAGFKRVTGEAWLNDGFNQAVSTYAPDPEFCKSITKSYYQAIKRNQPIYEHIRALFYPLNREAHWLTYERLIVPTVSENRTPSVTIIVNHRTSISIPMYRRKSSLRI